MKLSASLGPYKSIAIVVGGVAGGAIFLVPATIAQYLSDERLILYIWIIGGMISLAGALCYAELAGIFPESGGEYIYLSRAFGDRTAFLYGWTQLAIAQTASIAALSMQVVIFFNEVLPPIHFSLLINNHLNKLLAILFVVFLSAVNLHKISVSARIQAVMATFNVISIFVICLMLLLAPENVNQGTKNISGLRSDKTNFYSFILPLTTILWVYDGWNNVAMVAGEIKNAKKIVPISLVIGILIVVFIYALANLSYFHILSISEVSSARSDMYPSSPTVASMAVSKVYGPLVVKFISLLIGLATVTILNNVILSSARIPLAMAKDKLFFSFLGRINRNEAPYVAILIQAGIASIYILTGTYEILINLIVVSLWVFYVLTASSVYIFRRRGLISSFRNYGFPFIPIVFLSASLVLIVSTLYKKPSVLVFLIAFMIIGNLLYTYIRRNK